MLLPSVVRAYAAPASTELRTNLFPHKAYARGVEPVVWAKQQRKKREVELEGAVEGVGAEGQGRPGVWVKQRKLSRGQARRRGGEVGGGRQTCRAGG